MSVEKLKQLTSAAKTKTQVPASDTAWKRKERLWAATQQQSEEAQKRAEAARTARRERLREMTAQAGLTAQSWAEAAQKKMQEAQKAYGNWTQDGSGLSSDQNSLRLLGAMGDYWSREYSDDDKAAAYIRQIQDALKETSDWTGDVFSHYSQWESKDEYDNWKGGYQRWQETQAQGLSAGDWARTAQESWQKETDSLEKLRQSYNTISKESILGSQLWDGGIYLGQDAEAEARYAAQLQELQAQIEQAQQKQREAKQDMTWANQYQYAESQSQMAQMTAADYAEELEKLEPVLEQAKALQGERDRYISGAMRDPARAGSAQTKLDSLLKKYGYEDVDALEQAVETYRSGAWFAERESRYNSLSEAPDFAELSAPASEKATAGFGLGIGTSWWGQGDPEYDYINNLDGARSKNFSTITMSTGPYSIYGGIDPEGDDGMTPEEIANYNYLYNKEGRDAAREYLDYLKYTLNARALEKVQENAVQLAKENPKLASTLSIAATMTGGAGLLDVAGQHIERAVSGEYRPIDYNTRAMAPTVTGSTIRETRAADIADATGIIQLDEEEHPILSRILNGKSLGDVYQLGMSMLDSLAIGLTPLGPFGAILLGGSAGTQGMLDALGRGASDEQALAMGILNGTFEALFEYVSLDKLLKGDTRNVLKAFFQQGFVEGTEEANTTFFNNIADILVMAEKSDYRQAAERYRAAGMSQEEAEKQALLDKAIEIGWDFIGGGIMGGVSGSGYTAVSNLSQNRAAQRIYGSSVSELVNEALEIDPDNRLAQELRQKLDKGGKASGNQIYNLVEQNESALRAQDLSRIQTAAANRLRALGESGDVEAVSAALAKKAAGEKLTGAEEQAISGSRYGVRVANELDAGNIRSGLTSSDWAGKIGTERIHAEEYGRLLDKADGLREDSPAEEGAQDDSSAKRSRTGSFASLRMTGDAQYDSGAKLIGENKNVTVKTGDGQEGILTGIDEEGRAIVKTGETETRLDIEEADMPEGARALFQAVQTLGESANAAFKAYDGSLTVQEYAEQWDFAQNLLAANGARREALDRSPLTQGLNPAQKEIAYDYGRRAYEAENKTGEKRNRTGSFADAQDDSRGAQDDSRKHTAPRRTGRVSYDGGVVEGTRYRGINPAKLTKTQKTQIAVVQAVAEAAGLNVTLFDGEAKGVQGIYLQNGEIYLNVNAGAAINRSTLLFVMAHELTHFIQQNAKAEYARLKNFVVKNLLEAGDGKLEELVLKKQNARGGLSYSEALDEVIADGCESMLKNSEAIRQLAKENRNLAEKIQDWIADFVQKLKKAFDGLEARHEEARILMEHAEELQALWDAGLTEAVHTRDSENAATEGGGAQYSIEEIGNSGKFYVQADREVLRGTDPAKWGKQISSYINHVIREEQDIAIPTTDGHVLLLTGRSAYKLSDRHISTISKKLENFLDDESYARKGRAATHIDELIQVARFDGYREDKNGKHENDIGEDGFRYYETYFRDFDGEYYRVRFSAGVNGQEETVYSIGRIEKRRPPAGRGSSSQREALQNGEKPSALSIRTSEGKSQEEKTEMRLAFEEALRKKYGSAEGRKNAATEGGKVQYSIEEEDGQYYVQADRQVLRGTNAERWGKQIQNYINRVIREEQDIAIPTTDGHILLLTGRSAYKLSDRHISSIGKKLEKLLDSESYARKGRAATHIDELVQVARFDGYREDKNGKHENDIGEDGFRYYEAYFRDIDGKNYKVRFSAGLNGQEETVYSIGRIEKRRSSIPGVGSSSQREALKVDQRPSESIIRTSEGKSQEEKSAIQIAFEKALQKKNGAQFSEWDEEVSDRELLLEAAAQEDASEAEKAYAKKVKALEKLQNRRQRLEKRLEDAQNGDSGENAAQLKERLEECEKQIQSAEERLKKLESGAELKRAADKARAKWWDRSMEETVRTHRQLREANAELQSYVDYYRRQSKRTQPGEQTANREDIHRLARALLKEHSSELDKGYLAERLQKLGDTIVSNNGGKGLNYRELRREAGRMARSIAENVMLEMDDNKELRDGIRDYLKDTRLKISEELRGDISDFEAFRRQNFGTFRLANEGLDIDSAYQELAAQFGEGLFPREITAHSDQLEQIRYVLDSLAPRQERAYRGQDLAEVSALIGDEILDSLLSRDVRQAETLADKSYRQLAGRIERVNTQMQDVRTQLRQEQKYRKKLVKERVDELYRRMNERKEIRQKKININRLVNRLSKLLTENSAKKHIPEPMKKDIAAFLLTVDSLSPRAGEKTRFAYLDRMTALYQIVDRQRAAMESGDGEEFPALDLPEGMKELLNTHINAVREAAREDREWNVSRLSLGELEQLEKILTILSTSVSNAVENIAMAGDYRINELSQQSMEYLDEIDGLREESKPRKFLREHLGWNNLNPIYAFKRFGPGGEKIFKSIVKGWSRFAMNAKQVLDFAEKTYTAEYAREAEKTVYEFQLYKRLIPERGADAQDDSRGADAQGQEENYNSKGDGAPLHSEERVTVKMSKAQVMGFYCLMKRRQAQGHILGAGIRISDLAEGRKTVKQAEHYLVDIEDAAKISAVLSEEDRKIADALAGYMGSIGSEWGNEVSMRRFGIKGFTEENYYPIRTDERSRDSRTPEGDRGGLYRLANMGFTKNTVRNANNAVVIDSIFDVFSNHMADMAKYNALVLPMLDAMKWINYREAGPKNKDGQYNTANVKESLERVYGKEGERYFLTFMQDLNGMKEGGRGEGALRKLISNYKVAAVGANIRVALQQPCSIVRAGLQLDGKYLVKGAAIKGGIEKAMQYSGLAVWKDMGYFDVNINRGLREKIKHTETRADKLREKSMVLAETGDKLTWGALWNACELETREKTGLSGEELMEKTAERFDEVILLTQVIDSTISRSQNMRNTSLAMSELTGFMSEPTLTYNTLLDAYMEFRLERRRNSGKAWEKCRGKIGRTLAVYLVSVALTSAASAIADAGRDDDEYQTWAEKWLEAFRENLKDNANPLKLLPVVSQLYEILVEGEAQGDMMMEPMLKLRQSYEMLKETVSLYAGWIDKPTEVTYYGKMTNWGKVYKLLQTAGTLSGIPMGGAAREAAVLWNATFGSFLDKKLKTYDPGPAGEIEDAFSAGYLTEEEAAALLVEKGEAKNSEEAQKTVYKWSLGNKNVYDAAIAAARADDPDAWNAAIEELESKHFEQSDAESKLRSAVKEWYQGTEEEKKSIDKQQAIRLLRDYGGMTQNDAAATVQEWTAKVVTGIDYSEISEAFLDGEISISKAESMLITYGGKAAEEAAAKVLEWKCEKDTGIPYSEIQEAYTAGKVSGSKAEKMLVTYGGKTAEEAADTLIRWAFIDGDSSLSGISTAAAVNYGNYCESTGMSKAFFYDAWKAMNQYKADYNENGDPIAYSKKNKILAYIDSLPISTEQKDALYRVNNWSENALQDAPWH